MVSLPDQEMAKRLVLARENAGFAKAAEAARSLNIPEPTYTQYENGNRGFKGKATILARRFRVSLEWLLTGRGSMKDANAPRQAELIGYIGAGDTFYPIDDHEIGAGLEPVDIPPGIDEDAVLVEVRGDSMAPRLRNGERIFYMKDGRNPADFVGLECVVKLPDGRMYVKDLFMGRDGLFDLVSHNAETIRDVAVEWAAPVLARVNRGVGRR